MMWSATSTPVGARTFVRLLVRGRYNDSQRPLSLGGNHVRHKAIAVNSLQGQVLVASPDLLDPNFLRTVVLIVQHNEQGALGLILNRRTHAKLKQVWEQVSPQPCDSEEYVHAGGPVEGPLMALHTTAEFGESEIVPGLFIGTNRDHLERLVADNVQPLRIFAGYAGWGAGQLEIEMRQGSWHTTAATSEMVFHSDGDLWHTVLRQITSSTLLSSLKIKHIPPDPRLN
jgi:putative transcriptional regulator